MDGGYQIVLERAERPLLDVERACQRRIRDLLRRNKQEMTPAEEAWWAYRLNVVDEVDRGAISAIQANFLLDPLGGWCRSAAARAAVDRTGRGTRCPARREIEMEPYKVVERSITRGRVSIDWPAVERASDAGGAVAIPLDGALNSTMLDTFPRSSTRTIAIGTTQLTPWWRESTKPVSGNKGSSDRTITSQRLVPIRQEEQRRAAGVLGLERVEFLGYEDGELEDTRNLRRDVTRRFGYGART